MKWMKSLCLLLLTLFVLAGCSPSVTPVSDSDTKPLTGFQEVADYIKAHQALPSNFITKKEAEALGWQAKKGNLHEVAPGKSIGGDVFRNREGKLPKKQGRVWHEADINYESGFRGKDRLLYSNDGLIYKTENHYETFEPMN